MSDRPLEFIFGSADSNPLDVTWGPYMFAGLDYRPARKRVDLITAEDSDGGVPLGVAKSDNMVKALRLRIDEGASMDAALEQMHRLQMKLDDAAKRGPDGLECVWRPEGASERSTFYLLEGEIAETPQEMSGADIGWYHKSPIVVVTMVCKPFFYGDWSTPVVASGSTPLLEVELENVPGDVDAEGEMTVTDTASQNRSHFEWGLESYGYDAASPSATLLNLASGLTVSGFAGTSSTESGSYSTNTVEGTALVNPVAVCGTSGQAHYGHKRIKIRCKGSSTNVYYRLAWRVGDGPWAHGDPVQVHIASQWIELDLGVIDITEVSAGTQRWEGQIEVWSQRADGTRDTYVVDYKEVLPAERFGKVSSPDSPTGATSVIAIDDFSAISAGMNGDSASTTGGAWTTGGDGVDFQASSSVPGFSDSVRRQEVSDATGVGRFARIGSVVAGSRSVVAVLIQGSISSTSVKCGAMLRYDSATDNCVVAVLRPRGYDGVDLTAWDLAIYEKVSGTWTLIDESETIAAPFVIPGIDFAVGIGGSYEAKVFDATLGSSSAVLSLEGSSPTLASSGTLATGRVGFYDEWPTVTAADRYYYLFSAFSNPSPPLTCYSGRSIISAHDRCERYDSSGTYLATPPRVRGSRLWIPPAGDQDAATRIVTKLRREDVDVLPDANIADAHEASVRYRPRYRNPIGTS